MLLACPVSQLLARDLSPSLGQILQEEGLPVDLHGGGKRNRPSDPKGMVSVSVQLGLFGHTPCGLVDFHSAQASQISLFNNKTMIIITTTAIIETSNLY